MDGRIYSLMAVTAFAVEMILGLSLVAGIGEPLQTVAGMGIIAPLFLALLQLRGKADD